jgi:hypothetical protein
MKRIFSEEENPERAHPLSGVASWSGSPSSDGPGSSAARRPSSAHCPGAGGFVRYQQSGFTDTASKPLCWTARRGNPGGFLEQYQGVAMNLRPCLVAGPEGS